MTTEGIQPLEFKWRQPNMVTVESPWHPIVRFSEEFLADSDSRFVKVGLTSATITVENGRAMYQLAAIGNRQYAGYLLSAERDW